jgi:hypothetical protein
VEVSVLGAETNFSDQKLNDCFLFLKGLKKGGFSNGFGLVVVTESEKESGEETRCRRNELIMED